MVPFSYVNDNNENVVHYNTFGSGLKIYVPAASVDVYKATDGWEEYANSIEAMPAVTP